MWNSERRVRAVVIDREAPVKRQRMQQVHGPPVRMRVSLEGPKAEVEFPKAEVEDPAVAKIMVCQGCIRLPTRINPVLVDLYQVLANL
jgi:hypothetical protein